MAAIHILIPFSLPIGLTNNLFSSYANQRDRPSGWYDGLNSKMIEKEKINDMFSSPGGMKNARKFIKEKSRKKGR